MLHALIMAGGGGTRFWPRSRQKRPKQFLTLTGDRSLLQQALDRIEAPVPPERTWVITAGMHREEAGRQLPTLPGDRVIGEPCGRDTAACIGLLAALRERQPKLFAAVQRIAEAWPTPDREAVLRREYEGLDRISIDYAVMEHAKEVLVVQAPYRWDDVGSWLALERMNPQDADGNTVLALHAGLKTKNCTIVADSGHLVATAGVDNLLIVQDGNATLVADRRAEAAVKHLVE